MKIKLLPTYYVIALLFGIYNMYLNFTTTSNLLAAAQSGLSRWDAVNGSFFLCLLVASGIILFRVKKKRYEKIHAIYPTFWYSFFVLVLIADVLLLVWNKDPYEGIRVLDALHPWYKVIYAFDIIIPATMLYRMYPEAIRKSLRNIRDMLHL